MDGAPLQGLDVDGQYLPVADQVQQGGDVVGTAAEARPAFDDEVRTGLDQDLLVGPQVERALERAIAEPRQGDRAAAVPRALLPGVVVGRWKATVAAISSGRNGRKPLGATYGPILSGMSPRMSRRARRRTRGIGFRIAAA